MLGKNNTELLLVRLVTMEINTEEPQNLKTQLLNDTVYTTLGVYLNNYKPTHRNICTWMFIAVLNYFSSQEKARIDVHQLQINDEMCYIYTIDFMYS